MKRITLKRVFHRDLWRYAILFSYDPGLNTIAKSISGSQYSSSNAYYYVDANEDALREVLKAFRDKADIDISAIASRNFGQEAEKETTPERSSIEDNSGETIPHTTFRIIDEDEKSGDASDGAVEKAKYSSKYAPVEFRIDDRDGRLTIKFTGFYDKAWIDEIKSYGKTYYDKAHREFMLPWSKLTVDSLSDYFSSKRIEVRVIRTKPGAELKESRKDFGDEVRSRLLSDEAKEGLELLRRHLEESRYSFRTVESYLVQLELFFKYYHTKDPCEITQNEVSEFIYNVIIKYGFSASYQNQMVSAVKLFYELSGKGKIIPQIIERPRRGRALPKVFSKEEISRILNSTRNVKHKLLLWIIYSCGLRRSEVINIKLTDIDRTRSLLHIREGKGGVDRIVPVSEKVWPKLEEYLEGYKPGRYLFEGQGGVRYSAESVYNVFKNALKKAGINKEVGVHSLRHSYATHLHENGLDIRYIQELLGHKSSRTTEIYTHVSRRNLVSIRSPIEDLDLKEQAADYIRLKRNGIDE